MDRRWVAIQRNPSSGSGLRRAQLLELVAGLRREGLVPRLFSKRELLARRLEDLGRRENLVCVVAAGGDGTVDDLINRHPGVPMAVLPLGTENLLARYLQIPCSGRALARIIAAGTTRKIDVCEVGGRRFVIMASLGLDAAIVHQTHSRRRGHITKLNYVQPICDSLRTYAYPEVRLYLDGVSTAISGALAVLVNLPVYALGLRVATTARGDDGLMDVRVFQQSSAYHMIRYFCSVATGVHERLSDVRSARAAHVRIESDVPVPIQVDGDPAGWTPAEVRVIPAALEVFAPPPEFGA